MESSRRVDVSVIVPVYNSGACLRETMETLINQTLKNIEIICVDDGSEDNSVEILEDFLNLDDRIRIFRREHEGAGAARNAGLSEALGEYVIFLDSDDIFDPFLLEKTFTKGKKTGADVVLFGAKRYDNRTGETVNAPRYLWRKLIPEKEVFSRKDMNGRLFGLTITVPWTKLFRRRFLSGLNLEFQNLQNSNDVFFVLVAMAEAERISIVREDLVCYRIFRPGSLQNRKDSQPLCFLKAYEDTYDELNRRGLYDDVERGFADLVLSGCVFNINTVYSEKARWTIIRALCSERFLRMGLLDMPEEDYDMPEYYAKVKGLPYALKIRERLERAEATPPAELIRQGNPGVRPKVSVIIPVYNTQRYLSECMDSIMHQTLKELEILCIDDGSEDDSLDFLLSCAGRDSRISVYRQENCGLSVTRNRGLGYAAGEYVYFMDSDDMLAQDALEHLYETSRRYGLDALYFDGKNFYESDTLRGQYPEFQDYYIRKGTYPLSCAGTQIFMQMRSAGEYRTNVGVAFYRKAFLEEREIYFEPGILHEDNDFTFRAMLSADRAGYVKQPYFQRRLREDSIMTANVSFAGSYGYFKSFLNMLHFLREQDFPEEMTELLYGTLETTLNSAKKQYNELSDTERCSSEGLKGAEKIYYRFFVEREAAVYEKLRKAWRAKSDINLTLQRTYAEKSEINRKLQITYGEKFDRGVEIKRLKRELEAVKSSETWRLARLIGFPVRVFRKAVRKIQG